MQPATVGQFKSHLCLTLVKTRLILPTWFCITEFCKRLFSFSLSSFACQQTSINMHKWLGLKMIFTNWVINITTIRHTLFSIELFQWFHAVSLKWFSETPNLRFQPRAGLDSGFAQRLKSKFLAVCVWLEAGLTSWVRDLQWWEMPSPPVSFLSNSVIKSTWV